MMKSVKPRLVDDLTIKVHARCNRAARPGIMGDHPLTLNLWRTVNFVSSAIGRYLEFGR